MHIPWPRRLNVPLMLLCTVAGGCLWGATQEPGSWIARPLASPPWRVPQADPVRVVAMRQAPGDGEGWTLHAEDVSWDEMQAALTRDPTGASVLEAMVRPSPKPRGVFVAWYQPARVGAAASVAVRSTVAGGAQAIEPEEGLRRVLARWARDEGHLTPTHAGSLEGDSAVGPIIVPGRLLLDLALLLAAAALPLSLIPLVRGRYSRP